MKKLIFILLLIPFLSFGQDKGIQFEHNTTWDKVKAKAKAENKHIFVDAFTTWCGPCKWMAANVFPQDKVGEFFNPNFVSLKIQMDETKDDSDEVKSWYQEAKRFAKDYAIAAYPTFLIFNPQGELVHRIIGGGEADDFIAKAKAGLNPETQYISLVKKFEADPKNKEVAKALAIAAEAAYDEPIAAKAQEAFVSLLSKEEMLERENLKFLAKGIKSTTAPGFTLVKENRTKVDESLGAGKSNEILTSVIFTEVVYPKMRSSEGVDFDALEKDMKVKYADLDFSRLFINSKLNYYHRMKNWTAFRDAANQLIAASGEKIDPNMLNSFAWTIFENCEDVACIQSAIAWSKQSLEAGENPAFIDTYANLLYKAGDKENGVKWQEKALSLADEDSKPEFQATLDKMKAGKPTWITE